MKSDAVQCIQVYMGGNFLSGKYALSVSLFISFHGELESNDPSEGRKKDLVDKYSKESNGMFLLKCGSI